MKILILVFLSFWVVSQSMEHMIPQGNCNINYTMGTKFFNLTECQLTIVNENQFIVSVTFTATQDNVWANRINNYLGHFRKDGNAYPLTPLNHISFTPIIHQTGEKISDTQIVKISGTNVSPLGKYVWQPVLCHYPCPIDPTPKCDCTMQLLVNMIVDVKAAMNNIRIEEEQTTDQNIVKVN